MDVLEEENTLADDLKAAFESLEAKTDENPAESAAETGEALPDTEETTAEVEEKQDGAVEEVSEPETKAEAAEKQPTEATVEDKDDTPAPASWKALEREHWKDVPKAAREAIMRREREVSSTMQQLSDVRKFADNFAQAIYPYRENIRREGATPLGAVQSLMQVASVLQSNDQRSKASQIATLIHRYGVDFETLAEVLESGVGREEPIIQQRVQAAIQPYQEAMQRQQQEAMQRQQQTKSSVQQELETFRADPKNEFFNDVREDMADIMDAEARRGNVITFKEAYDRACKLNPEVSGVMTLRQQSDAAKKRAEEARAKQRAAKSVQGVSSGGVRKRVAVDNPHDDLRADLEAAFSMRS